MISKQSKHASEFVSSQMCSGLLQILTMSHGASGLSLPKVRNLNTRNFTILSNCHGGTNAVIVGIVVFKHGLCRKHDVVCGIEPLFQPVATKP